MPNKKNSEKTKMSRLERASYLLDIGFRPTFARYFFAYEQAVNALFSEIAAKKTTPNLISFPLLYLIRHCLELGYKTNINHLARYSDRDSQLKGNQHNLLELHREFKKQFYAVAEKQEDSHIAREFGKHCKKLDKLVDTLNGLDQNSESFRYPCDKKERGFFKWDKKIDLLDVKTLFDESLMLLSFTADVLAPYTDFVDSMKEYEQEFS